MEHAENVRFQLTTKFGHYRVVDTVYAGRPARVLFSGRDHSAQSAIALDEDPQMVFDYNQRFLELAESLKPNSVLQIGGGAFTLPTRFSKTLPETQITAVEQDAQLKKIAKRFFGLVPSTNLDIVIDDGRNYLARTSQAYDLILLDAYLHSSIPRSLATEEFLKIVDSHLNKNGVVAANIISAYHGLNNTVLKQHYATYKSVFRHVDIFPADKLPTYWISQNFLLVGTNKTFKPHYNLRFDSLQPLPVSSEDILHDYFSSSSSSAGNQ